ncbi:transmembrane protein, putative (macronuclear) [Tetrahymena thermophila SB210]|uniref:Transmembrane protein, putative n=1 Tax=Tetrahymena thermophila (strain SB210) TaxID=312017 RepID=W7XEF2_TETTS|nr:transmembrane protein, putative [Tetrahymena thermophila SB210]EWS71264.1 transmembrane protein, putative [Tetrahymena thermophila SB210]|eukprot:XP_012656196.1 transmembrane protein, putative [Tetrahymena thermophila SB210]
MISFGKLILLFFSVALLFLTNPYCEFFSLLYQDQFRIYQHHIHDNLNQHYIQNVRIVNETTSCNYDEQLVDKTKQNYEGLVKEVSEISIFTIQDVKNEKYFFQLCVTLDQYHNFYSVQNDQTKDSNQSSSCVYKGLNFQSKESPKLCPISDIIFSEEEKIEGYEKFEISKDIKTSMFIKREDSNSTPLVGLYLQRNNFLQKVDLLRETKIAFTLNDLCSSQQKKQQILCQTENQKNDIKYNLSLENQFTFDMKCKKGIFNYEYSYTQRAFVIFRLMMYSLAVGYFFNNNNYQNPNFYKQVFFPKIVKCLYLFIGLSFFDYIYFSNQLSQVGEDCLIEDQGLLYLIERMTQSQAIIIFYLVVYLSIILLWTAYKNHSSNKYSLI